MASEDEDVVALVGGGEFLCKVTRFMEDIISIRDEATERVRGEKEV